MDRHSPKINKTGAKGGIPPENPSGKQERIVISMNDQRVKPHNSPGEISGMKKVNQP